MSGGWTGFRDGFFVSVLLWGAFDWAYWGGGGFGEALCFIVVAGYGHRYRKEAAAIVAGNRRDNVPKGLWRVKKGNM